MAISKGRLYWEQKHNFLVTAFNQKRIVYSVYENKPKLIITCLFGYNRGKNNYILFSLLRILITWIQVKITKELMEVTGE